MCFLSSVSNTEDTKDKLKRDRRPTKEIARSSKIALKIPKFFGIVAINRSDTKDTYRRSSVRTQKSGRKPKVFSKLKDWWLYTKDLRCPTEGFNKDNCVTEDRWSQSPSSDKDNHITKDLWSLFGASSFTFCQRHSQYRRSPVYRRSLVHNIATAVRCVSIATRTALYLAR